MNKPDQIKRTSPLTTKAVPIKPITHAPAPAKVILPAHQMKAMQKKMSPAVSKINEENKIIPKQTQAIQKQQLKSLDPNRIAP